MTNTAKLRPYEFFGVDFKPVRNNAKDAEGTCPFCSHRNRRFSVNLETGQYRCWHCDSQGNTYSFLSQYHQKALEATREQDYRHLATDRRGIPWTSFRDHLFARRDHSGTQSWLIPAYSPRDRIIGLRTYNGTGIVLATAGLPLSIWRLNHLKPTGPIFVCEGEWDALALERLRTAAKVQGSVLGVPGASVFKQEWLHIFQDREVILCYDNDTAGQSGTERATQMLTGVASTIRHIQWPSTAPSGFDLRDLVFNELQEARRPARTVWSEFTQLWSTDLDTSPSSPASSEPPLPKRTSYRTLLNDFTKRRHLSSEMKDGLALMLATALSIQLPGDPIWMFIVGPPGSGKTMFLHCFDQARACIFKNSITPKSLISGFQTPDGEDPSLIQKLQHKVLILKDYTEIITLPREQQEEIYGILRGAYDGRAEKTFGNGITRTYEDCYFAMLAGVTDVIHGDDRANLGERFLKYQLVEGIDYDPTQHITAAIHGMVDQVETERYLSSVTASFLNRDLDPKKLPKPEPWFVNRIIALSQIVSHLRSTIPYINRGELAYRPSPEIGTRLAKQLVKLATCLAVVWNKPRIDKTCYALIEKVAFDTCRGWSLDIVRTVAKHVPEPVLTPIIEHQASIPSSTCNRRLQGLIAIGTLVREKTPQSNPGHPTYGYTLSPTLARLWKDAKLS